MLKRSSLLILFAAAVVGCAHAPGQPQDSQLFERKLLVLEQDFAEFTAKQLELGEDDERLGPEATLAELDKHIAELERLRLRYLDVLSEGSSDRQRVVAMVRIAELHLDLGARVRRVDYPADSTPASMRAFDERLGRVATPLEAVGYGVLTQVVDYAERRRFDGRFVRRARLYTALHSEAALSDGDLRALHLELRRPAPYGAPRRLLEAGRVGQRASRR
jgi:hypothetical protein